MYGVPSERVTRLAEDPDDPQRCQNVTGSGRCMNLAESGHIYCLTCEKRQLKKRDWVGYDIKDQETLRRLQYFDTVDEMRMLRHSLSVLDQRIEKALNFEKLGHYDPEVSASIERLHLTKVKTIEKIAKLQMARGQMLSKQQSVELWQKIQKAVFDRMQKFEGWEDEAVALSEEVMKLIDEGYGDKILL